MVAYAFERRLHVPVLAGVHLFTLRSGGRTHARIGDALSLLPQVGKPPFAEAECCYRGRILFAERGIVRVLNPAFAPDGNRVFRLMQAAEQGSPQAADHLEKVAAAAGYDTWADLVRWHERQGQPDDNGLFAREVIGFSNVRAVI